MRKTETETTTQTRECRECGEPSARPYCDSCVETEYDGIAPRHDVRPSQGHIEGVCDNCDGYTTDGQQVDGFLICPDCL